VAMSTWRGEPTFEEMIRSTDSATARRVRGLLATGSPIQRAMALALLTEKDKRVKPWW